MSNNRFRTIEAFAQSETGLKTAGIVAAIIMVTSIASFGANTHKESGKIAKSDLSQDQTTSQLPSEGSTPSTTSAASGRQGSSAVVGAPGAGPNNQAIPPALRGVDFGLKTQGVTDKEVKVGFSGNFDNCGDTASLVESLPPGVVGDPVKSINTFVRWVNEHGGVGGRKYVADIVQDGGSGCPERNLPAAVKMADQDKVFLAAPGLHVESDYIINKHIPVWGGRDDPASLAKYGANGFALFEPIAPTIDAWASFGKYYLKTTDRSGPEKACLIRISNGASGNWDFAQKRLRDDMKSYGITFVDEFTFKDDVSTAQAQSEAIAIRERDKGCQHVYFLAGNPIGLIFITNSATKNQWFPHKWTWTGYTALADDDKIAKSMDQVQWENAVGLTYRLPPGKSPYDGNCKKIWEQYNGNDGNGDSASVKIACSAVLSTAEIMKRGAALTGKLDSNAFVIGANAIRDDFFWDAHVPMDFNIPSTQGPFKTRAFSHYTVADWSSAKSAYEFPVYPCYYRTFGPNKAGCENLERFYKK